MELVGGVNSVTWILKVGHEQNIYMHQVRGVDNGLKYSRLILAMK